MEISYKNQKILIIGMGISGRSAAGFLLSRKAAVIGVDRNSNHLDYNPDIQHLKKLGLQTQLDTNAIDLHGVDLVILSPGIPKNHPLAVHSRQAGIEVIGEIELGFRNLKNPVWGITGTNGKTTVTLLVAHVLNHCGHKARALGNVGIPFTQEIDRLEPSEIVVLELSSYQLETLYHRVLDEALLLNITPDHLDRYASLEEYAAAKLRIQACLKAGKSLIIESAAFQSYADRLSCPHRIYGYSPNLAVYSDLENVYYLGEKVFELPQEMKGDSSHDLENMMGAYALCASKGVTGCQFIEAYGRFRKPPHRIEFVLEHNGVRYYDDSKGTNIDAVVRAVRSLKGPIILIAGGVDKKFSYARWVNEYNGRVRRILAIGEAAVKIKQELDHEIPVEIISDLEQAILRAAKIANGGDVVLLSPGCASFDMFNDYAHRGDVFQRVVRSLVNGEKKCLEKIQY